MRGLIEKDIRLTLIRKQTIVVFIAMALFMGVSMNGSFVVAYLTMLAMMIAIGTLSYDELDNGYAFLMTLPIDKKTYVKEKYLFTLGVSVIAWCIGAVLFCIVRAVQGNGGAAFAELPELMAIIPVMYMSGCILIPLQLKYGAEKSRIALFIIFGLIAVVIFGSTTLLSSLNIPVEGISAFLDSISTAVVIPVLCALCIAAAFVSYLISTKIMEKKEF